MKPDEDILLMTMMKTKMMKTRRLKAFEFSARHMVLIAEFILGGTKRTRSQALQGLELMKNGAIARTKDGPNSWEVGATGGSSSGPFSLEVSRRL